MPIDGLRVLKRHRLQRRRRQQQGGMMAAGREGQRALLDIVNAVPDRKEQLVMLLHREHAVEAADHRGRIAEIDVRQQPLAQHVDHGDGMQRRRGAMPGDVQHERREILPVEHLVAERVAAEPRAWLDRTIRRAPGPRSSGGGRMEAT